MPVGVLDKEVQDVYSSIESFLSSIDYPPSAGIVVTV